jgi:predicted transcriptional regulator
VKIDFDKLRRAGYEVSVTSTSVEVYGKEAVRTESVVERVQDVFPRLTEDEAVKLVDEMFDRGQALDILRVCTGR